MLKKCDDVAPGLTQWRDKKEKCKKRGVYTCLQDKIRNDTRLRKENLGISTSKDQLFLLRLA